MSHKQKPKLGQNFLTDDRARHAIVDALGDLSTRTVLEIGPGHGSLTGILAERAHRLFAVELDPPLARELTFRFRNHPNVVIVEADFLTTDLAQLAPGADRIDIIGNLPYYITSDILLHLFTSSLTAPLKRAVLMMQREVADRVSAAPGIRDYGMLAATTALYAEVQNLFTLPPSAFSPPPDVHSTVLRLEFAPRFAELKIDAAGFQRFLRTAFAQKRKTLANNLRAGGFAQPLIEQAWPASVASLARAETVTLEGMAALYRALNPIS